MMDEEDRCGSGDDDHEVLVKVEFDVTVDADGELHPGQAVIHSHVHNVPPTVAAQTLVVVAHKILSDHMAHDTFAHIEDHALAHTMAEGAASAVLLETARNIPGKAEMVPVVVPDDISSLIEGD
jgi:hypothetical protein